MQLHSTRAHHRGICTFVFVATFPYNSEDTEASYMSMEIWIKKMWKVDTSEFYAARKNKEVTSFTRTELHLVKQNKPDSDRFRMLSPKCKIYMFLKA
ncbi:hypothetical protein STEG23_032710 [Scotinomys teguina]